jgi:NAD(P)-dependent dehydrogenase (short-subunit alcohol dehydrogenase family)
MSEHESENATPVVVITGGAGGMGRACARRLGAYGRLLLTDVADGPLDRAADELRGAGFEVETEVCDVADADAVGTVAERARGLGPLRAAVHTAGVSPTMGDWRRIVAVDLVGTAHLLDALLPLARRDTAVVCVASVAGHLAGTPTAAGAAELHPLLDDPRRADLLDRLAPVVGALVGAAPSPEAQAGVAYALAKYGVIRLCQRLAPAWGARGARLVSLSPGIIETAMGRREFERQPMMAHMLERTPLGRMGRPEEIAAAAEFLVSPSASFVTGCDLLVDGGVTGVLRMQPEAPQPEAMAPEAAAAPPS